jgi:hypothetical protein
LQSEAGQVLSSPVKYSDTLIAENMATHVNDRVLKQVLLEQHTIEKRWVWCKVVQFLSSLVIYCQFNSLQVHTRTSKETPLTWYRQRCNH